MKIAEVSEYKGHPILSIPMGEKTNRKFSFGIGKAWAILDNIDDIREFVKLAKEGQLPPCNDSA